MLKLSMSTIPLRSHKNYMKLGIPKVKRKTFANGSFSVMEPRLWNGIPNEVKECAYIETFKKELKTFF